MFYIDFSFLVKCYVIGILGATGMGPIFILTFNRGASRGFWAGFVTAFGAALADSMFFILGLAGALTFIGGSLKLITLLDFFGGLLLLFLGYSLIKKVKKFSVADGERKKNFFLLASKSFLITTFNPLVLLFFMVISVQVLPDGIKSLSAHQYLISSFMVLLGSITVLTSVALAGFLFRSGISREKLKLLSVFSGIAFICAGIFLLSQFFINFIKIYRF